MQKKVWHQPHRVITVIAVLTALLILSGCSFIGGGPADPNSNSSADNGTTAKNAFVPPGELDDYYLFSSGGHSGQVFVFGVPSMRRIRTIPVFSRDTATGYGYSKESKEMLGDFSWGDLHHVALSETDGQYDGRWLYANDNANNRAAVIDLKTFETIQVTDPIPNVAGPHCAAFVTPNNEYLMLPSRFGVPIPQGTYVPIDEFKDQYRGILAAMKIDQDTGKLSLDYELLLPPWSYDLSDAGKGPSEGWQFLSTYNTEEASETLEIGASKNDRDYLVMINWKKAAQLAKDEANYEVIDGAKMIDPSQHDGLVYLIPVPKSPHGADVSPDGRYIVASGKLSPTTSVYDFEKIQQAIDTKDFSDEIRGFKVLNYDAVLAQEVEVGMGPLHTQFDGNGYAYTSLFLESAIAKWELGGNWQVVDKESIHYNVGHLAVARGDTVNPDGKWLVSLNKMSKDRYLSVGPSHPESLQLIDISGDKMKLVRDAPVDPEPHYAQMIPADKLEPLEVYAKDENRQNAVWDEENTRIERRGNTVEVWMTAIRSRFTPDTIEVNEGNRVIIHVTNLDRDEDITHGFGIQLYDLNMEIQPGGTNTIEFTADKPGVYPFYCTNFCSALHQEMQGWLLVKPSS